MCTTGTTKREREQTHPKATQTHHIVLLKLSQMSELKHMRRRAFKVQNNSSLMLNFSFQINICSAGGGQKSSTAARLRLWELPRVKG